ncbi:PTS mannose/fructose/sorbose transporter subunit IIAB [Vagococcus sp. JNUCC 83]
MKKFVVATHEKMAQGVKDTLELFAGSDLNITYMCAYVEGIEDIDTQINCFFDELKDDDQAVIFTDMFGGSVNQKMILAAQGKENVFIVAGFNLPVMIEIIYGAEVYTDDVIEGLIKSGRDAMQLVKNKPNVKITEETNEEKSDMTNDVKNNKQAKQNNSTDIIPTTLRVDERLVHGQIAMVWSKELSLQGIIVANDEVANNETQQMALKMAVPSGIKVLIRSVDDVANILNDPRASSKRILVLVRTVGDALRLAEKVPNMNRINIGNVGKSVEGEKKTLTQFVMLTPDELEFLSELTKIYPETALQNVPSDRKELANKFVS